MSGKGRVTTNKIKVAPSLETFLKISGKKQLLYKDLLLGLKGHYLNKNSCLEIQDHRSLELTRFPSQLGDGFSPSAVSLQYPSSLTSFAH